MKTLMYWGCCAALAVLGIEGDPGTSGAGEGTIKELPAPILVGEVSVEEAIAQRRSVREFANIPLTLEQISQLCWAGQGITDQARRFRAAPSAGALFPIELYVVTADGVDHYRPAGHKLERHLAGDLRPALQRAALHQDAVGEAAVCMVITAVQERSARKYGRRAERYCLIEAGHVAQNVLLQATALHLAGVPIGAFEDDAVAKVLGLPASHRVLYLVAIGNPR
jgi:SagB-type dehydrogenase family enzyme